MSVHLTADQLLRDPAGQLSEPPRSLSNTALLASLRPPPDYGGGHALRRTMEPHLVEGMTWFLERAPWQRALLSTGMGALVGIGIVVTIARLFVPELSASSEAAAATAALGMTELTAPAEPAAAPPLEQPPPRAEPAAPERVEPPSAATVLSARAEDPAPALAVTELDEAEEAKPAPSKKRKRKAASKRSKRLKKPRATREARETSSLPARWADLYARGR